ncbi:Beta-hexosaminidase [Pseudoruegeria aquimaris]|uniref:beta-N-acetylhexosaminidase n=1 Tax=Pseudoruegeria aquimaris TaxID=393663 RepID=A0A1Y5RA73_9RHOB|nr:beta-N-acetylhexosaminidase [Pseudoruegeria aquimaris]SLN12692.1 Beta-hexosaminidase [Pseudoruegeria aquimaris]
MSGQGAVIFGCEGLAVTAAEKAFFAEAQPWGFILFARNVESPAQLARLTADLREAVGRDVPVFIDQEGGRVQRMRAPHWSEWLPPLDEVARAGAAADRALFLRYRLIAAELRAVGIDGNCSPCADVATPETHPVLRNRCLSSDAAEVAQLARVVAEAHLAGGVLPVLKHIPGHGRATLDSHKELPRVSAPRAALEAVDFAPFKALADLPLGMSAHIVFEAIAPDGPATTSPAMVRLIRDEIGFGGLLMTDDLSMEALSGTVAERARAALAAGCDMILHCNGKLPEMEAVAAEAGRLEGAALARAEAALAARRAPEPVDLDALRAEHAALLRVPAP